MPAAQTKKIACRRRSTCRLCSATKLTPVISLAPTPPANAFVDKEHIQEKQELFPLDVFLCQSCAHLQLLDVVDPGVLFSDYVYVSGTSPVFVEHFKNYARYAIEHFKLKKDSFVIDIGSNDGTLLKFFKEEGFRVLGIDPAVNIAKAATAEGIETIPAFFDLSLAKKIRTNHGQAGIVTANNVFAHSDHLKEFTEGVRELLGPDGVFIFEVSYLADVVTKILFDTIYHEHVAYHSVKPLVKFFDSQGMRLIDALRVDSHGGSLRASAALAQGSRKTSPAVAELLRLEEDLKLNRPETFRAFETRINKRKEELVNLVRSLKAQEKSIGGFGAPAKATTLMYHFGLGPDLIDFIVDDSPLKQGLFSPGHHIPVLPSKAIEERRPDYLVIFAWNFAESIIAKNQKYLQGGGHFIVPLPELKIY
ncbi:MAG: methyltransferase domain-containing protein [Elusimicrobia bacterium]|nr:methyltransferase domain-containing protein [Elusimicrobiota bacterium]